MTALVEDLLLLARLDSGRPLEREPVDLTRLLVEAVSDARVVAPDHRWRLDAARRAGLEVGRRRAAAAPGRHQPADQRPQAHPGRHHRHGDRRGADGFAVHDDGPGFPPDLADHAFERFARGDARPHPRRRAAAPASGLALVEAIVTAHGGTVTLASRPGDTTVAVTCRRLTSVSGGARRGRAARRRGPRAARPG